MASDLLVNFCAELWAGTLAGGPPPQVWEAANHSTVAQGLEPGSQLPEFKPLPCS